ncbi:alginate export family protein [Flavobacterium adhaerens]|uniref:alginate export family protein n=1 Tax=Flavobacterium adhaerens TaxID=3149043 RepID=UPI0032B410B1
MNNFKKMSIGFFLILCGSAFAQEFDVNLQIRPRYEFRNGYHSPIPYGETAAQFVSNRTRLGVNFKLDDKLVTKLTFQNIRVWGDVVTNTKSDVNGIQIFEAWAQYNFNEKWSTRLGRQVMSYDNQRILGEIDWAQQGQSHDAALVSFKDNKNQLDVALAYNANSETDIATPYTVSTYKTMQYAWFHTAFGKLNASFLFLNTGYENKLPDPIPTPIPDLKVDYMQTFGTYFDSKNTKWECNGWFYGQTGQSNTNTVSAFNAALSFNYAVTDRFKTGLGYEFVSGKSQNDLSTDVKSFNPLFGTNHAFNGYMDYFYVGNYKNTVGLQDAYLNFGYSIDKLKINLLPHFFSAANTVIDLNGQKMNNYLGTEIDLTFSYAVYKYVSVQGGYSQMFGTDTLQRVKSGDVDHTNNWAWLMINVNPQIFKFQ